MAVKTNVKELATGTDNVKSIFCKAKMYIIDPSWFNAIGTTY